MGTFITGVGVVTPIGSSETEFHDRLIDGSMPGLSLSEPIASGHRTMIGRVSSALPAFPEKFARYRSRTNHLLYAALLQLEAGLDVLRRRYRPERIGVIIGTCTSGFTEADGARAEERRTGNLPAQYDYAVELMDSPANFVAYCTGVKGLTVGVSTACTSSAKAIAMAHRLLRTASLDAVVVGGADSVSLSMLNGFDCLGSLSRGACRPFGEGRDGINLGEAAALLLVSRDESEVAIMGVGESSDGHHISSPDPAGVAAEAAIRRALMNAGRSPDDIGYVNLHGTATPQNDDMEAGVMHRIFGNRVACSSTKNLTGHTLGAAGALELAACAVILKGHGGPYPLIPQHGAYPRDPRLAPLRLAGSGELTNQATFLSNSFAFGGSNVCIAVGKTYQ